MANDTIDKITNWAATKYATGGTPTISGGSGVMNSDGTGTGMMWKTQASTATPTATSGNTGMLAAASTPPAAPAAPAAPASTGPKANVADWYRTTLGRDGDAAGMAFWQSALDSGRDAQGLFADFQKAATANKEAVKPTAFAQANSYAGPTSTDGSTIVDDWGRNVLGRDLTGAEQAQWKARMDGAATPDAVQSVYKEFLSANSGQVKNALDLAGASQISQAHPAPAPTAPSTDALTRRTVDRPTETVQGQLANVLAADSQVLQQARAEGQRQAADRGLLNSSIAASAGTDAMVRAATGIATTDAAAYGKAADYNAAAANELMMYSLDQVNQFKKLEMQLGSEAAARAMQVDLAKMQDATSRYNTDVNANTQKASQAQQMTIAQMQDATSRLNAANSNDSNIQQQKMSVANSIMQNMEMSPDRKAAMLESLGFGTMARDGQPGTGMAGAVYVIDSTSSDLNFAPDGNESWRNQATQDKLVAGIDERARLSMPSTGPLGGMISSVSNTVAEGV